MMLTDLNKREKIKILHLEDNEKDAELIKLMLNQGNIHAEILHVKDKESYLRQIEQNDYDLILSDYSIPQFDGLNALLAARGKNKNIPFIYCSGTIGEDRAVQCLKHGAMDYVLKSRLENLVPAVNRALRLISEIKEKERAEEELSKIRLAVENTGEAVLMTDTNAVIQYINPAFTQMYGWEPDEVIGKQTPRILKSSGHNDAFYSDLWRLLNSQKPFNQEMINRTKSGILVEIKNTINPVLDRHNMLVGYVSIQSDISLRKAQEREILRAKHESEEMNKLKTYFLSNISHEMKTPLISILGFSEILMNDLDNKELYESAKNIYESGTRLHETINSILSFQELERKEVEISPVKYNLINLLNHISKRYEKEAAEKGLSFKSRFDEKEVWLNSDPSLMETVVERILNNSIKFTNTGGITISLNIEENRDLSFAVIKISDSGIGIPYDKIGQIFSPFRQASEGLSRAYEGIGLGLNIAKQIMNILNGLIEITGEPGKGTQVKIKIPILPREKEIKNKINFKKTLMSKSVSSSTADKPLVLLVEDNEDNRKILKRYLKNDFLIEEAEDGITGISKAELKQYDLILMDINLGPGMDGIETCRRIRESSNYENTPVVAVTAYSAKSDRQKFIDQGFSDYIQKPIMKEDLLKSLKKFVH